PTMWRNYLTVGLRNLARNKTYAVINILGLAIGLAACFALFVYVRYETSYDRWLPDSERIFQVQATWHEVGQPVSPSQSSPAPVRDTIASISPQVEAVSAGRGAQRRDLTVTGVVRGRPRNTHLAFGALVRFDPASRGTEPPSWGEMGQFHYVRLRDPAAAAAINAAFPAWEHRVIPP